MDFLQWIQAGTQVITAITAVVMAYFAYHTYLKSPEQEPESEPETPNDDDAQEELSEILVFKTSNQKTFLSVVDKRVSCRIEDSREGKGGIQWSLSRSQAQSILETHAYHVNPGYKVRTGTFTLGPRRNWLYTKSLFPEPDYLESVLKKLLQNTSN